MSILQTSRTSVTPRRLFASAVHIPSVKTSIFGVQTRSRLTSAVTLSCTTYVVDHDQSVYRDDVDGS